MDKRRWLIGLLLIAAVGLYIWIQFYEIPAKINDPENNSLQSIEI